MPKEENKLPDLFGLAKEVDFKDYMEDFYQIEFTARNFAECPFCESNVTKAFSFSPKKQIVKCFSCMPKAYGLIDFVMAMESCDNHKAAKKICIDKGLHSENTSQSKEELKAQADINQAKRTELKAKREIKRAAEEKVTKANQTRAKKYMSKNAPDFVDALRTNEKEKENLKKIFRWSNKLEAWWFDYLGWDEDQESLVIINQDRLSNKIYNMKHQKKWAYEKNKGYDKSTRADGKWISQASSETYPFPMQYFKEHTDERVVLSFGEKDSLNLLSYDINTLTLGGISNSIEPFKDLFKNKTVYIWADHQLVEYISAMLRYKELEDVAKNVYIVSFLHIDKTLPEKYDISDFIFDNNFKEASDIFERIEYSCFNLTNSLIEDIAAHFHENENLLKRLDAFRLSAKSKNFIDIEKDILKVARPVKSEMDKEIDAAETMLEVVNKPKMKDEFKGYLRTLFREEGDEYVKVLELALDKKARLFSQFRKHHEVDATLAFINDARASGHEIASYRENVFIWTGSHYVKIDTKVELNTFIIQKWMRKAKVNMKQQTPDFVDKVVKGIFYRAVKLERYKTHQNHRIINFDNGTAYLYNSGKFVFRQSHLKADAMTSMLPISYDPNAKAPKWNRFLKEVLPDTTEQDALMEFIGYCFYSSHSFQKFLFLLGSGANGKSIVLNVIKKFFGKEVTSNVDLQQLYSHEMVGIEDNYINIGSEINPKGLDKGQIENLKKLTAGEDTMLNPKNSPPYDISGGQIPKFIFSGNNKPQGNLDGGLFRRMLLLNFNRVISKKERIQSLENRFEDEMSGIFNLAMVGLERLLKNGDFSTSDNMERNLEEYKEEANPILAYFNENITIDKGIMIPRKFLYAHYKKWTEEKGHHAASERTFYSKLRDISKEIVDKQTNYAGIHKDIIGKNPKFLQNVRIDALNIDEFKVDKNDISTKDINLCKSFKVPVSFESNSLV